MSEIHKQQEKASQYIRRLQHQRRNASGINRLFDVMADTKIINDEFCDE